MNEIEIGGVYVDKGKANPYNALVITKVEGEAISFFDTSSMNTLNQIRPCFGRIGKGVLENFFEKMGLANLQQAGSLLSKLKEEQQVIGVKVGAVEKYVLAQSSPKCTDEDLGKLFQDGLTSEERARYFDVPNFLPDNEYPGDFPVKF